MTVESYQKIEFLGCLVENFSANLGFNSSPSTLSVSLVEDPNDETLDGFTADSFNDESIDGQIKAATGGTIFQNGNPGDILEFSANSGSFKFTGLVTSYKRSNSVSGRKIDVSLSDLRFVLKNIPVLSQMDFSHTTVNVNDFNLVDSFNSSGGSAVSAKWTPEGMPVYKILDAIESRSFGAYNRQFNIRFPTTNPYKSLRHRISQNVVATQQVSTISSMLDSIASENNFDWYIDTVYSNDVITVNCFCIPRLNTQDAIFSESNSVSQFINSNKDRLMSFNSGRELRDGADQTILIGDNIRTLYQPQNINTTTNPDDRTITPVFSQLSDGIPMDQVFIDLSNIQSDDPSLIDNLPNVVLEAKNIEKTVDENVKQDANNVKYQKDPKYQKLSGFSNAFAYTGYFAPIEVLRAALHSIESWETIVWYTLGQNITYNYANSFDRSNIDTIGTSDPRFSFVQSNIRNKLGVYYPYIDLEHVDSAFSTRSTPTLSPEIEALKTAVYNETLRHAEEYYGKHFIVRLPDDKNYTEDLKYTESQSSYELNQRQIITDYDLVDAAPALEFVDSDTDVLNLAHVTKSENTEFVDPNGLIRPFFQIDGGDLLSSGSSGFQRANFDEFDLNKSFKFGNASQFNQVNPGSSYIFCTSDIELSRYQFDQRFCKIALAGSIKCGYNFIRNAKCTLYPGSHPDPNLAGKVQDVVISSERPTPFSEDDTSGGTQEFFSYLFRNYAITANLQDNNGDPINVYAGQVDANYYSKIINNISKNYSDIVGFDQTRWIGIQPTPVNISEGIYHQVENTTNDFNSLFNVDVKGIGSPTFAIPLVHNYKFYGPWWYGREGSITFPYEYPKAQFLQNKNLNPWSYGTYDNMIKAGLILAENNTSLTTNVLFSNVTLTGLPEFLLGDQPSNLTNNIVETNLSGLSVNYSNSGVSTTYSFKTYFGPTGFIKKDEIDQKNDSTFRINKTMKDFVRLESIIKDVKKSRKTNNKNSKPFNSSGSGSVINAGKPSSTLNSATTIGPIQRRLMQENSTPEQHSSQFNGMVDGEYYAGVNEIFVPYTTLHPDVTFGIATSSRGIRYT